MVSHRRRCLRTITSATRLYLTTWKRTILFGVLCAVASLFFKVLIEHLNNIFTTHLNFQLIANSGVEIAGFVALSIVSIFLLMSVAFELKMFVTKTPVTFKQVVLKAFSKIIPILIACFIIMITFGVVCTIFNEGYGFLLSQIHDWHVLSNQLVGTLLVVISFVFYIFIGALLLRSSLYGLAILFDDKGIFTSIADSFSLVRGWRNIVGTLIMIFTIQMLTLLFSGFLPTFITHNAVIHNIIYLVMASLVFPWGVACLVCWFWHLQKRGYLDY